jgi:hypothetical protein
MSSHDINMIAVMTVTDRGDNKVSTVRVIRVPVTPPYPQIMVMEGITMDNIPGNVGDSTSRLDMSIFRKRPCPTGLPPKNNRNTLLSELQSL